MKTLLTSTLTALLAISILAPAEAAWYAKFDGVDGSCKEAQQALEDLKAPETEEAIALLLPAVQKIREAAARTQSACGDPTGGEGDVDCAAQTLSDLVIESTTGRDGSPGLLNLVALALDNGQPTGSTSTNVKKPVLFVRKSGKNGATGAEQILVGILIGLLKEIQTQGIKDPTVLDPIVAAIMEAEEIDPEVTSVKRGRVEYDLKFHKRL